MKRFTFLFLGIMAWSVISIHAQITKASLWAPTAAQVDTFIYGGNYKNTQQAGVTITVLDKGYPDRTKVTPVIGDYKFPHWDLLWHFNKVTDNKGTLDVTDDIPTTYMKVANIAYTDSLYWVETNDTMVPFNRTVAASHLPTRNGILFSGIDALEGRHAFGLVTGKDWARLQSYQGGGNAVLVETVSDFIDLINCHKAIKERARAGSSPNYTYSTTTYTTNFSVPDSVATFAVKVGDNDNALAFYPGMYNKTDLRLAFQFDSSRVDSDITFKLMQVSKGTSGKNMIYKMIVSIVPPLGANNFVNIGSKVYFTASTGCDKTDSTSYGDVGPNRYVIDNIFETQGGANEMTATTTINLADLIKTKNPSFTIDDFSKKRIIVSIIGQATEAAAQGTYHPILALDDIHVSYWIDWYKTINSGLVTSTGKLIVSSTKIIGLTGQIQITDAKSAGSIYSITGQKVATFVPGSHNVVVPEGIYLVKEQNQPTKKVLVR